jgi:hypothetical protein
LKPNKTVIAAAVLFLLYKTGALDALLSKIKIVTGDSFGLPGLKIGDHVCVKEPGELPHLNNNGVPWWPLSESIWLSGGQYLGVVKSKNIVSGSWYGQPGNITRLMVQGPYFVEPFGIYEALTSKCTAQIVQAVPVALPPTG